MIVESKCCLVLCVCLLLCVSATDLDSEEADEVGDDYDIVEDFEETVKQEIQTLKDWWKEDNAAQPTPDYSLCPPPVTLLSSSSCNATKCAGDSDCLPRNNNTYLCCFNGCVDTCIRSLDPPLVFDWLEDPPDRKLIVPSKVAHSSPPEEMALRGGCVITPTQFVSLERFKQNEYVSDCFCDIGGVFCKIEAR